MDEKVVPKIGRYEIVSELGRGGVGAVYEARDPIADRTVALKLITPELLAEPELLKRFYRETESAAALQHPNIVTIYDFGEADGYPYIAMEFVAAGSFQTIINRRARIPLATKLQLVQQLCDGLGYAHKHGFVHRDVKPANILVTHDGNVKVGDFGIYHLESANLSKTATFLGTIPYASPELIDNRPVDNRSDLWSVTAVLYEFIAYKKAFNGPDTDAIIARILSAEPDPLSRCCPGVPADLDEVISKGLNKNMEQRYQSLNEMLVDLLPIAGSLDENYIPDTAALEDIPQDQPATEPDLRLKEALSQTDNLISAGSDEEARAQLLELQQDFPDADEINRRLQILEPLIRSRKLVKDGEHALSQGEYAEAVRALTEALRLNPQDEDAPKLMDLAREERERLRQIREALGTGHRAMRQGDSSAAEAEFQRALQLDPTNTQATAFLAQIQQLQATHERETRFRSVLGQADNLAAEGRLDEAQHALLNLQAEFPDSAEIDPKLLAFDRQIKVNRFVAEGQQAFDQGEFGEAVRIFSEAQEFAPSDARVRDLKVRAVQERDRLRRVREAISSGQRAMRQGDSTVAEREYQRALQLDPANSQAITLLAQLQKDRPALEPDQRLKEGLSQAEILISAKRFDEAQSKLMDLQQAFPDAQVVPQTLQALNQRRMVAAAAPTPPRPTPAGPVRVPSRPTPVNEFTKSMALAEELRRSLQKPRTGETGLHSRPSVPVSPPAIPVAQAPMPSAPVAETSPSATAGGVSSATMLLHPSAKPQAPQASSPQIQVTPPAPPRVEPNTPVPAPLPPHVSPPPAVSTGRKLPKMLPMIVAAVVVLVVIVLVGAFLFLHHS